jgi:eukaryotic-like serine/threonine-protein kinase
MNTERWQKIDQMFHAALEREALERSAFLLQACAGDDALLREVQSLVNSHEKSDSFIETPAGDLAADWVGRDQNAFAAGQQIENYRIVRELGSGGMGQVYLADDTRLNRKVALKLLPPHFTVNPDRVRRFAREAQAASALNHPNIVTIFEIGQSASAHFIATEFIDGKTLRQLMREKPLTLSETLNVAIQVADALVGAHSAGIIHRDIKPENIMVRADGYVKILDFGLAKLTDLQTPEVDGETPTLLQSSPGLVMGTVQYMSPEQSRGKKVDIRTDIWSLGIVLYELLAGRVPFSGETASHVMVSLMEDELPSLTGHANVPPELDRIVNKALRKRQKERYQTALQVARDLKSFKQELQLEARLQGLLEAVPSSQERGADVRVSSPARGAKTVTAALPYPTHTSSSAEYVVGEIKRHKRAICFAAAALATIAVAFSFFYFAAMKRAAAGRDAIDSVAVLLLDTAGKGSATEYLSDGMSDSIIDSLARIPNLRVIPFSTVSRYKGKQVDPQAVGRELNVRAVLVLRMTPHDGALTINAELMDVLNNRRLWSARYDPPHSDVLAVQTEIAREIAGKLRLQLGGTDKQRLTNHETESAEAYDAYLRGRFILEKHTATATAKSIEYLEQATKLDPNYALAYATLSFAYWSLPPLDAQASWAEFMHKAKLAAMKALELDESQAEAHAALGLVLIFEGDLTGAEAAFKRGLDLNPASGFAHTYYAQYLKITGHLDEAIAESQQAVKLEPASMLYNRNLEMNLYFARRYDEAIAQGLKTLELDPNMQNAHRFLAKAYEQKKLYGQAVEEYLKTQEFGSEVETEFRQVYANSGWQGFWRKALELKMKRAKTRNLNEYLLAQNYARLGELDQALATLEKIEGAVRSYYGPDPFWDDFQSAPRYQDFVRRVGIKP